jgi:hypothetical protein
LANGFFLNKTASIEIGAERRMVRHSGNSSDTTRQFSPIGPRLFRNTEHEAEQMAAFLRLLGDRTRSARRAPSAHSAQLVPVALIQRTVKTAMLRRRFPLPEVDADSSDIRDR